MAVTPKYAGGERVMWAVDKKVNRSLTIPWNTHYLLTDFAH